MSTPDPKSPTAGDAQADSLAAELLNLGSFGDPDAAAAQAPLPEPAAESPSAHAPSADAPVADAPDLAELEELLKSATFDDSASVHLQNDLADELLSQARSSVNDARGGARAAAMPTTSNFDLPAFQQALSDAQASSIDLLRDVDLNVKIELGRSRMMVEDVLKLSEGSVVELDKLAGDPVDVFVNDRLVARGEVLVLNDNFCVRINEIVASAKEEA
ncbi:MAG TPA: flagellar motor switch protein FliN [Tepidisphaeraceae bacterium]